MNPIVHDLDKDDRPPEKVIVAKKELDISFIPFAVSVPLLQKYQKYLEILKDNKVIKEDGTVNKNAETELSNKPDKASESLNLIAEIVAMFTTVKDPEMDIKWLGANLTLKKMSRLMMLIINTATKEFEKGDEESKKKSNGKK